MDRLVAALLIPFLLMGNLFAHSHGLDTHPSPHDGRAHIHIGCSIHHEHHSHDMDGDGHGHRSDEADQASVTSVDHDSDAIYFASAEDAYTPANRVYVELGCVNSLETLPCVLHDVRPLEQGISPRSVNTTKLPLYLLQAALRL